MKKVCVMLVAGCVAAAMSASPASALPPFNKAWQAKYVDGNGNANFVAAVGTAKCNVCHEGKSKKDKNEYGKAVGKYLTKADYEKVKKDADAAQKYIAEGLAKAEAEKSNGGQSYGDMLKAGVLPAQ